MKDDENHKTRRTIRLPYYDYGHAGAYFVTICVQDRICLFGHLVDRRMVLNELGRIVATEWQRTAEIRPNVALDEFIVMPNHLHAIINILEPGRGVSPYAPTVRRSPSQNLGAIIRGFKAATTKRINEARRTPGAPVWQRNYYEHVIRNEDELDRIREYIANNPAQWALDRENPRKGVLPYALTDGIESIFGGERP